MPSSRTGGGGFSARTPSGSSSLSRTRPWGQDQGRLRATATGCALVVIVSQQAFGICFAAIRSVSAQAGVANKAEVTYLQSLPSDQQVIIVENFDPPNTIKALEQVAMFSKNPHSGRYGFFPYLGDRWKAENAVEQ